MSMINCPECGKEISSKATSCPYCGCPIDEYEVDKDTIIGAVICMMLSLVAGLIGWISLLLSSPISIVFFILGIILEKKTDDLENTWMRGLPILAFVLNSLGIVILIFSLFFGGIVLKFSV